MLTLPTVCPMLSCSGVDASSSGTDRAGSEDLDRACDGGAEDGTVTSPREWESLLDSVAFQHGHSPDKHHAQQPRV